MFMRAPERLDRFYDDMKIIHKNSFPDWRFGQLMCNFFGWVFTEKKVDPFFPEETDMIDYLREFADGEDVKWGDERE